MPDPAANLRRFLEERRRLPDHAAACAERCRAESDCGLSRRRRDLSDLDLLAMEIGDGLVAPAAGVRGAKAKLALMMAAIRERGLATDDATNVQLVFIAWLHAKARALDRQRRETDFAEAAARVAASDSPEARG